MSEQDSIFSIGDRESLRLSGYPDATPFAARRLIKKVLRNRVLSINTTPLDKDTIKKSTGGTVEATKGEMRSDGVVFVSANVEASDSTAPIRKGCFVVHDCTTGFCVTGINPKLRPDEYEILGIALADYDDYSTIGSIPILMGRFPSYTYRAPVEVTEDMTGTLLCKVKFKYYDDGAGPTPVSDDGTDVVEAHVWLRTHSSDSGAWLKAGVKGEAYWNEGFGLWVLDTIWIEWTVVGTLQANLPAGGSSTIIINDKTVTVHDNLLPSGKRLKSGSKVHCMLNVATGAGDWKYMVSATPCDSVEDDE